jgi:hypothetical protein
MRLTAALTDLLYDPDENRHCGGWSREELEAMNARFAAALEAAFQSGQERRESAAAQVTLPASSGPRWSTPLCPTVSNGLLRSTAPDATVFVAR